MLAENLLLLRKQNRLTQEQVAEAVGVSRQALSKWENGESAPDIDNCIALANFYNVTLDDLVRYNSEKELLPIPPRGKHCFGVVTVGENGAFQLPEKALKLFSSAPGMRSWCWGRRATALPCSSRVTFCKRWDKKAPRDLRGDNQKSR